MADAPVGSIPLIQHNQLVRCRDRERTIKFILLTNEKLISDSLICLFANHLHVHTNRVFKKSALQEFSDKYNKNAVIMSFSLAQFGVCMCVVCWSLELFGNTTNLLYKITKPAVEQN